MASVATKRQAENKTYKAKYKEKFRVHRDSDLTVIGTEFQCRKRVYVFNKKQTLISDFFLKQ